MMDEGAADALAAADALDAGGTSIANCVNRGPSCLLRSTSMARITSLWGVSEGALSVTVASFPTSCAMLRSFRVHVFSPFQS